MWYFGIVPGMSRNRSAQEGLAAGRRWLFGSALSELPVRERSQRPPTNKSLARLLRGDTSDILNMQRRGQIPTIELEEKREPLGHGGYKVTRHRGAQ